MRKLSIALIIGLLMLLPLTAVAAVQKINLSVYPLTPGLAAQYTIGFYVSGSGAIEGGSDRINIEFPEGTSIPSSIGSGKIMINGKSLSSSFIYVSDNTLTLRLPSGIDIGHEGYVGIVIPQSADIRLPLRGGNYYLLISTTQDSAAKSSTFSIDGTRVRNLEITVSPPTVDEYAEYEIGFETSSSGSLTGGEDYIYIEFPDDVYLPRSISNNSVRVNGEKPMSNGVEIDRNTNTVSIKLPSGKNIKDRSEVTVTFDKSAGIRNPEDIGKYELGVYTSKDSLLVEEIFNVGLSISPPVVTVSPDKGGEKSQYFIGFTTSPNGTLEAGDDYIYLYFPEGTYIPSSISSSYVTVNGFKARSVTCTRSELRVAIRMPSDINIQKNSYAQVVIRSEAGIKNPSKSGKYQLEVATSTDTGKVKSKEYTISGVTSSSSRPTVDLSNSTMSAYPEITIEFELGGDLEGGYDEITVVFPDQFSLPSSLSRSDITINGERIASYEIHGNKLVLTVPEDLYGGDDVEIVIASSAGIRNPMYSGNYQLEIYTSRDSGRVQSRGFSIGSSSASELPQVELSSYRAGESTSWFVWMFASREWDLNDWDSIIINFPAGTTLPSSIDKSLVTINDEEAQYVLVSNRTMTILLSDEIVVKNGDKVVVHIAEAAGIKNPNEPGSYSIEVITPENDDPYESIAYDITSGSQQSTGNKIIFRIGSKLASRGNQLVQLDAAPTIINDFTVVPLRALGDALGAVTEYDSLTQVITVKYNNKELIFIVNSRMVKVDGEWMSIDVAPTIIEGRTMIPARFVSQSFGAAVEWNADTQEVIISN